MKEISALDVFINGLTENVGKVISEWAPGPLKNERQYRDSLFAELKARFPKAKIEREYRDLGTTTDICLIWDGVLSVTKVYIELKYNFSKKTEYNRLLGQIIDMSPKDNKIFVVLCGHTDTEYLERLKSHLREYAELSMPYFESNLQIVVKP